jgi:hypothetical protein
MNDMNMTETIESLKAWGLVDFVRRGRRTAALIGCGGLLAAAVGCSDAGGAARVPVFPVKGTVRFEGRPASGAFVVFHPRSAPRPGEETPRSTGQVQPDGAFELTTTSQADGAPAGDYAVTVQWTKLIKQGGDTVAGPNVIPPIYGRPETTPLKVTVKDAPNQLDPFNITKDKK